MNVLVEEGDCKLGYHLVGIIIDLNWRKQVQRFNATSVVFK